MGNEQANVDAVREIGKYAIRTCSKGEPVDAALNCFIAGITLLAFAQEMNPAGDGEKLLEDVFERLRKTFHDMVRDGKVN